VAQQSNEGDWVARIADDVVAQSDRRAPGKPVVVASGISPSGPVHLGNLREIMVPHLVADEVRRRGIPCDHVLSWDDYDRLRRVPAGFDPSWSQHIGQPLTSVPAPPGSEHSNWAEHFKAPLAAAMDRLAIEYRGISQTQMYTSGAYLEQVLRAMSEREHIDAVLARYRTKVRPVSIPAAAVGEAAAPDEAARLAEEGSGAAMEDEGESAAGYFPFKPYCSACGRDMTVVTAMTTPRPRCPTPAPAVTPRP
jgi:lysyl-tRNA synthetase, class I